MNWGRSKPTRLEDVVLILTCAVMLFFGVRGHYWLVAGGWAVALVVQMCSAGRRNAPLIIFSALWFAYMIVACALEWR